MKLLEAFYLYFNSNAILLFKSVAYIQQHFRLYFIIEANYQNDLGTYCLQEHKQMRERDQSW